MPRILKEPAVSRFEEVALARIKASKHRITMPRVVVIRALANAPQTMNAYEIHKRVIEAGNRVDVVSVYRIINFLVDLRLVVYVGATEGYCAVSPPMKGVGQCGFLPVVNKETKECIVLPLDEGTEHEILAQVEAQLNGKLRKVKMVKVEVVYE